ncbi:MAG: rhodanese-related sulfurtransferase [Candidatus Kerfeldbacteria bacterium]|nr:rhodanese-related sulfurtransferase [Candidatus Kerfeldbacteria bacterium]
MYRVLLYYKYVPIENPEAFVAEHKALCSRLGLKGRVLIAHEGLNGTLSGSVEACEEYKQWILSDSRFAHMAFKEHDTAVLPFPRLRVVVRPEVVTLGVKDEGTLPYKAGKHLTPEEWHALAQEDDVVILDGRNMYEARIGKFKNAITPDIQNFREFPQWVKENKEKLNGKKVLMYCTGGIRCEKASAVVKETGIEDVYQLNGGIINYGKHIPDGLWEGSCYVFDARNKVQVNDDAHHTIISKCDFCKELSDQYVNCANAACNKMMILCASCREKSNDACSAECAQHNRRGVMKPWLIDKVLA